MSGGASMGPMGSLSGGGATSSMGGSFSGGGATSPMGGGMATSAGAGGSPIVTHAPTGGGLNLNQPAWGAQSPFQRPTTNLSPYQGAVGAAGTTGPSSTITGGGFTQNPGNSAVGTTGPSSTITGGRFGTSALGPYGGFGGQWGGPSQWFPQNFGGGPNFGRLFGK